MPTTDPHLSRNAFESDKSGTVARILAEGAIERLRQKGGIFVEAVKATRMAMVVTDPTLPGNPIVFANDSFLKLSGYRMDEVLGQQPYFLNGPDTDPRDAARFQEALRNDQDDLVETIQYRKDGTRFTASVLLTAFKDTQGQTVSHFLSWLDVTRRNNAENRLDLLQKAQTALRESEERQRFLLQLSDAIRPLLDPAEITKVASRVIGEQFRANRAFYARADDSHWLVGKKYEHNISPLPDVPFSMTDHGNWIIESFQEGRLLVVDDMRADDRFSASEREAHLELQIGAEIAVPLVKESELVAMLVVQTAESRGWTDREVELLKDVADRTWSAVERARAEEALCQSERRANLLLAELQHRVRNTLAVVRSIARRTAENSSTAEEMLAHFQGRLDAFSRVQSALTRNADAGVDLQSLIDDELIAHATREGKRLQVEGPEVTLSPKAAEPMSLAIHELATNAVKHGALSNRHGKVIIRWRREAADAGERLVLTWEERGVRLEEQDERREGFGMELLCRSLPYDLDGESAIEFRRQGLKFTLDMPLR